MGFSPKFKISEPFPRRSRVAGSGVMRPAGLENFVTARARTRCFPSPVLAAWEMPPTRSARRSGEPRLWLRPEERSSAARPPPSDKRHHQSRSGSGKGSGLGCCGPTRRGQGAEPRPVPHLLAKGSGRDTAESPAPSGHLSQAQAEHEPPVPAQAGRFHL